MTLFTIFYDLSVSRNFFSMAEMRQFGGARTDGLSHESNVPKLALHRIFETLTFGPKRAA